MLKRRTKGAAAVVERMWRDPKRGDVYWFLWDEHDTILQGTQGKPIRWKAILKDIRALGLTNGNGQPVTNEEALGRTWRRVCADKRREAEAKQQRAAARRRPTNDPPPVVARTWTPTAVPVAPMVPKTGTRTPEEQVEWMRNEILSRSGKRVR